MTEPSNEVLAERIKNLKETVDLERAERKEEDAEIRGNQNWLWRTIILEALAIVFQYVGSGGFGPL